MKKMKLLLPRDTETHTAQLLAGFVMLSFLRTTSLLPTQPRFHNLNFYLLTPLLLPPDPSNSYFFASISSISLESPCKKEHEILIHI